MVLFESARASLRVCRWFIAIGHMRPWVGVPIRKVQNMLTKIVMIACLCAATGASAEGLTGPQRNAVRSAKQYLSMQGFSRNGLIKQLSSDAGEGYAISDATAAVDSLNVDWNKEAAHSAEQYLSMQGFSCKGLARQLSSSAGEGFTVSQATYGAQQAGACK